MKKNSLPKPITILVLTLITTILWVILSIYRSITVKPAASVPENISKTLSPTLNTAVIQKIDSAIFIPDSEIPPIGLDIIKIDSPVPTFEPVPTIIPEASPSALPSASPSASPQPLI
jgi:hypothetical protein